MELDTPSLWEVSSGCFSGSQPLNSTEKADVVIIGAGVTGLSAALHLKEKGYECAVIEARRPGDGATGRGGGLVAPDFVIDTASSVAKRFGSGRGERFVRLVGSSARTTFDLISNYGIECESQQQGFVSPVSSPKGAELLVDRGKQWQSLGFPVKILDESETRACIGTSIYRKALHFEQGGALNPFAYAVGLAETVRGMGVPIFVESPVDRLEKSGKRWRISTARGAIEANRVVLAANAGNFRLHRSLEYTAVPMAVSEYATRALTPEETRQNLGRALPYTDRQPYMFTARLDDQSRIISALPGLLASRKLDDFLVEVADRFERVYPDLEDPRVEYIWQGVAYLNRDLLPAVYAPEGSLDLLAINACNGRGIAVNTAIGREIAALIQSGDEAASAIPITKPKRIPFYPVVKHVPAMLMTFSRAGDRLRRYRAPG